MLGSLKTDVTRTKVAYVLATRRSWAKKSRCVHSCQSPITEKTQARPTTTIVSTRGNHAANGARATTASSATNGKTKKASSMDPCCRSCAQRSDAASTTTNAAAGSASTGGNCLTGPRTAWTSSATHAAAST